MLVLLQVIAVLLLLVVFYQDYRHRAVYWILFPLLALVFLGYNLKLRNWEEVKDDLLINLGFIAVQLLLLTIYFSIKYKRPVNISSHLLGWGDILFIVALGFLFSPLNFVLYYLMSLLLVVTGVLSMKLAGFRPSKIPLAGIQALFLSCVWFVKCCCNCFSFYSDEFIAGLIL